MEQDKTAQIIIGLITTLLILTNGAQYVLNETGSKGRCNTGWMFQESGEYEGMYACRTSTSIRHEYCARVWDSSTGKLDYWCAKAVPVFVEPDSGVFVMPTETDAVQWICHAPASRGCELKK